MIAFHYQDAMAQAKDLRQVSDDLYTRLNRSLEPQQSELAYAWRGDSANLFLKKTEDLYADIEKTAKLLAAIAKSVEISARAIKAAEDAAKEIVNAVSL